MQILEYEFSFLNINNLWKIWCLYIKDFLLLKLIFLSQGSGDVIKDKTISHSHAH